MRTENEIYDLILKIAKNDTRIKAVYMNGSRTNEMVPKDILQDYDIVYVVDDTKSFIEDNDWPSLFGEILYMQYPDENPYYPSDKQNSYGYLMQFADGTRIDLIVQSVNYALQHIRDDKLCKILLDKANILPEIEAATDCQYWVKKPTKEQYLAVCNEFWWCTNNIAKGLWREELPYVQDMTNYNVRTQLITMLNWKVGILTDWSVSTGNHQNTYISGCLKKNGIYFYQLILIAMSTMHGSLFLKCANYLKTWQGMSVKSLAGSTMKKRETLHILSWNLFINCPKNSSGNRQNRIEVATACAS